MGQSKPLNNFSFTYGICKACKKEKEDEAEDDDSKWTKEIEAINLFYNSILGDINKGIYVEPTQILAKFKHLNLNTSDLILGVLHPLLVQVGQYFDEGKISIEKEHLFSKSINEVIAALTIEPDEMHNGIVLFSSKENIHTIGLNFLKLLIVREIPVSVVIIDYAPNTFDEFLHLLEKYHPKVIGVSFALPTQIDYLKQIIQWCDDLKGDSMVPTILAGGQAASEILNFASFDGKVYVADAHDTKSTIAHIVSIFGTKVFSKE
jgi:methanogenic corrinoid protein MtbC1